MVSTCRAPDYLSDLQVIMLSFARGEQPARQIAALYAKRFGEEISEGTLYTTLTRLAKRGLLKERRATAAEDSRMVYYRATPAGQAALDRAGRHARKMVRILAPAR